MRSESEALGAHEQDVAPFVDQNALKAAHELRLVDGHHDAGHGKRVDQVIEAGVELCSRIRQPLADDEQRQRGAVASEVLRSSRSR